MKAKDLAAELMKYPDFDVEFTYMTFSQDSNTKFPDIYNYTITGICDIGHSDKVIVLDGELN